MAMKLRTSVVRLAALLVASGLLFAAREEPVEAAFCCESCVDLIQEYEVNCPNGPGQSPDCADLHNQVDFCLDVCTISSCGNPGSCVYICWSGWCRWYC